MEISGFEIEDELGRGGFGVVYRARQVAFNRMVAIKILHGGHQSQDLQKQFARECRAVGALRSHRHILRVYSTGLTADGAPYLAMELLTGGSLTDRLPLSSDAVRGLGIELAAALQVAHDGGVIHRDVKPGNVLYNDDDEPVLVDFGISSLVGDPSTTSTEVALSLGYAPPEVLGGARPAVAADVYALGATLFAAVSGRTPFVGEGGFTSIPVLAARILNQPVEDLRPKGVPDDLCAVIERAMAKDPADRFLSMADMRAALMQVRDDDTVRLSDIAQRTTLPMPPEDPAGVPAPRQHRRRTLIAAACAAVLVLAGIGVAIWLATKVAPVATYDASNLNCQDADDLLGVGSFGKTENKLLFYSRGPGPDQGDPQLPTTYLGPNQGPVITNNNFGDSYTTLLLPGDLTGDGKPDLLGEDSGHTLHLMKGNCTGGFDPSTSKPVLDPLADVQFTAVGDFDGDHRPDLLGVDHFHHLFLYHGLADGKFVAVDDPVGGGATLWSSAIGVGDVNGDGYPDVINRSADGSLHLFESNGHGGWLAASNPGNGGLALRLSLPPKQFPYVIGNIRFFNSKIADLAAIDIYGRLLVFRATGSPAPASYSTSCDLAGQGWYNLPPLHTRNVSASERTLPTLRDVAGAVSVPSVPLPTPMQQKTDDPIQDACTG